MTDRLYHYDVYLRAPQGTVKRMVSLDKRSVRDAEVKALHEVKRSTGSGDIKILDVVPLRCIRGKAQTTGRGMREVRTTSVTFKQTRRPKARASLKLSRKGKLYTPKYVQREEPKVYEVAKVSDKLSEKETGWTCESPACKQRGSCISGKPHSSVPIFLVLVHVRRSSKVKSKPVTESPGFVWVQERAVRNREQAAEFAQQYMKASHTRVTTVRVIEAMTYKTAEKRGLLNPHVYFRSNRPRVLNEYEERRARLAALDRDN